MNISDMTAFLQVTIAYLVMITDYVVRYRAANSMDRLAKKKLNLPRRTPVGERMNDCMIGATAIVSHLVDGAPSRPTAEVHKVAESVLAERGHYPSWETWVSQGTFDDTKPVWHHILSRLELPLPRELWFSHNNELAGKGVLIMANLENGHAVAYAHGLVSDPSRPAGYSTWETLPSVLHRYGMDPKSLFVFEDCDDGRIGSVPTGGHGCTYQFAK